MRSIANSNRSSCTPAVCDSSSVVRSSVSPRSASGRKTVERNRVASARERSDAPPWSRASARRINSSTRATIVEVVMAPLQQIEELLRHRFRREWILSGHQVAVDDDVRGPG